MTKSKPVASMGLDFAADETRTGYRLDRVEVYNWGTFHGDVYQFEPNGYNTLVTGDKGSGKTTLADAITTMLCSPRGAAYNKASGVENTDRNLRSYVMGYYSTARDEVSGKGKPVALREGSQHSVILASFRNEGFDKTVTLAIVLWMKDGKNVPERYYVGAEKNLTIRQHFSLNGGDVFALKKRLRQEYGAEPFESFTEYGAWFRRRLGIKSPQAMELFHQTVSMKEVPDLTEFVRRHMLEPLDVESLLNGLITHYDVLTRSHDAIIRAREQEKALSPLIELLDEYDGFERERALRIQLREVDVPLWFDLRRLTLLHDRVSRLEEDELRAQADFDAKSQVKDRTVERIQDLREARLQKGGMRIETINNEIRRLESDRNTRQTDATFYAECIANLGLDRPETDAAFREQASVRKVMAERTAEQLARLDGSRDEQKLELINARKEWTGVTNGIKSLRSRTSNIDERAIELREALCEATGLSTTDLPFLGELIQVKDGELDWEGAIERVLRTAAQCFLVPEEHYRTVSSWVNSTPTGRLVRYYHMKAHHSVPALHPSSLVRKVDIRRGPFAEWVRERLTIDFNYACAETLDIFRRESKAITREGQTKGLSNRHEKDDRYDIKDRRRYVLGWTNEAKIAALEAERKMLEAKVSKLETALNEVARERESLEAKRSLLDQVKMYTSFARIDWKSLSVKIAELEEERTAIERSSDVLQKIKAELDALERGQVQIDKDLMALHSDLAGIKQRLSDVRETRNAVRDKVDERTQDPEIAAAVEAERAAAYPDQNATLTTVDSQERGLNTRLTGQIDSLNDKARRRAERAVRLMAEFRQTYPVETAEFDANMAAAKSYRDLLDRLVSDDLPRFEKKFKEDLNENTINEIVQFATALDNEKNEIEKRIDRINESMKQIDFAPGRFLRLTPDPGLDVEVREFRAKLKSCTEDTLTGSEDDLYSERKFLQVKELIERFKRRPEHADEDLRWTRKVTDVRNWFQFGAEDKFRDTGVVNEYYQSTAGKSGGQKEVLAVTVLAASLAYQFGLAFGERASNAFRFVMLDEAFCRGTDESVHYGLSLLERLGLQVILVTPLQKLKAIEPHIARVGFVYNPSGKASGVKGMTLDEYVAEREKARTAA